MTEGNERKLSELIGILEGLEVRGSYEEIKRLKCIKLAIEVLEDSRELDAARSKVRV